MKDNWNGLLWKPLDWDEECPRCRNGIEVLTASKEDNTAYEGDEVRCVSCHAPGSISSDGDRAWITWEEDDHENGTTDYCKLIRENKALRDEVERLLASSEEQENKR
jgi:hypothetical protein